MSMNRIAVRLFFSRSIELIRERDRTLRLPDGGVDRSVLLPEKRAAVLCEGCLHGTGQGT